MASCPHDWEIYFAPVYLAMIADWRMPGVQGVWTVLNLSAYQAIVKFNDSKIHCFASWESRLFGISHPLWGVPILLVIDRCQFADWQIAWEMAKTQLVPIS